MSSSPTMSDVLKAATKGALASAHTALVCCVVSYDETTQTATLRSCMKFKFRNADGKPEAYEPPLLTNVPIVFPSSTIGGSVFSFVYPVSEGDEAIVIFNERSIDEWKTGGGDQYETQSNRRFDLSDGVAIVGLRSPSNPLDSDSYESDAAVLRSPKMKIRVDDLDIEGNTVDISPTVSLIVSTALISLVSTGALTLSASGDFKLGSGATDFVALASAVESELASLWTAVNTHTHPGVTVGAGVTGPSSSSGSAGSVGATKVKAE